MKTQYYKIFALALLLSISQSCENANSMVDTSVEAPNTSGVHGEVFGIWNKNTTIYVSGDIIVPEGKSLVLEEGVTVIMDPNTKPEFIVKGNLYSMGTAVNPVKITGPSETRKPDSWGQVWGGILATPTCTEMLLDHTIIELGGATTTEASTSVKMGLYKAKAGENLPALWFSNTKGKLVITNSVIRNFHDDATYLEGGELIISKNKFYSTGNKGGEGINIKSGVLADISYNLFFSNNTNALKLSNSGGRSPQAHVVAYNNTIINTGWRRPDIKGGSVWLENSVYAEVYNTLFANTRFGIKQDTKNKPDSRSKSSNNLYYGYSADAVSGFTPNNGDILSGSNDVISTTPQANDPKFKNYPLNNSYTSAAFTDAWDFHLSSGSPALSKGSTNIIRNFPKGLTINNTLYESPEPSSYIGAYGQ
ncbi:right-handed parallel beta-helix repeat-containing protein [Elizabethkingia anophelis]|uniref:right-handed parallel beta-helix repeat-containing protein n=1 Tax=Elizabethkingia anophelis TaxID=1117645 RepID=UPI000C6DD991|nr:right-handed parallel beta-helix repeat-containing protein [Elizabethkingia anophelis]MCT3922136.1 right-handed parallel beta-helix repeat-containing protein [Elizabethkingia anophelis]MCT3957773.1 right-handed parallel beta-helix repeat-containing protein [Elizabethkingia anophelis]MCT4061073.1 right-handed parallel beta-helix repeat-containing protein [Elizabethkingia anophelis]MCT4107365.1 right-handed parallel beta-helix repeat-containing protein [Elizabethkingia anophelis]MCT4138863.1 